jgi:hypothetical protein
MHHYSYKASPLLATFLVKEVMALVFSGTLQPHFQFVWPVVATLQRDELLAQFVLSSILFLSWNKILSMISTSLLVVKASLLLSSTHTIVSNYATLVIALYRCSLS